MTTHSTSAWPGSSARLAGYHAVMACDTLLLLGCDFAWRQFYPDHARIVQIFAFGGCGPCAGGSAGD
jgi:thiamine pyrophosphate-dependent acetolactate synthase large subunit-like protein